MAFNATLVVLAAGMGSRFGGLKQIEPIGPKGEAILDFSIYDAKEAGFNKVVFVIKHEIEKDFKEVVGKRMEGKIDFEYVYQEVDALPKGYTVPEDREKPWGTAHAILCCRDVVKEPFAVINADDYYGKSAFKQIYEGLKNGKNCMVAFRLGNTITENGYVSRGVCKVQNGKLETIKECKKIDGECRLDEDGVITGLSPDTPVSMNFWGLMPSIFGELETGLYEFLDREINVPKSEYFLPIRIGELIEDKKMEVDVFVAEDKWYGVTYKEDKDAVVNALKKMVDDGLYKGM